MSLRSRKAQTAHNTRTTPSSTKLRNDDDLVNTIRLVFKEEFGVHENKINDIIKANMEAVNVRLNKSSEEVVEIKKSLEFTQNKFDEELAIIKSNIKKVKFDMKEVTQDLLDSDKVSSKLIKLEDRSRRSNLRIEGIAEDQNESWHECGQKVLEVIKEKLEIQDPVATDTCPCMGKYKRNRPRIIIFKLNKFKEKQKILRNARNLKDTGIFIYEDFCDDTMELRKSLQEQVLEHRRQNKIAYLNYRSIVVRHRP